MTLSTRAYGITEDVYGFVPPADDTTPERPQRWDIGTVEV